MVLHYARRWAKKYVEARQSFKNALGLALMVTFFRPLAILVGYVLVPLSLSFVALAGTLLAGTNILRSMLAHSHLPTIVSGGFWRAARDPMLWGLVCGCLLRWVDRGRSQGGRGENRVGGVAGVRRLCVCAVGCGAAGRLSDLRLTVEGRASGLQIRGLVGCPAGAVELDGEQFLFGAVQQLVSNRSNFRLHCIDGTEDECLAQTQCECHWF